MGTLNLNTHEIRLKTKSSVQKSKILKSLRNTFMQLAETHEKIYIDIQLKT